METGSILIAETDPVILQALPSLLSSRLPRFGIDVCTSVHTAARKLSRLHYSTVVAAPRLIHEAQSSLPRHIQNSQVLMPVIVTAAPAEVELARDALLNRRAFDVLAKPIDSTEALTTVRMALWQARFLKLLTQRDRVLSTFQRHLEVYPQDRDGHDIMDRLLKKLDETVTLVQESMKLVDPSTDGLFFELAGSVEEGTKQRALARLDMLSGYARNPLGES